MTVSTLQDEIVLESKCKICRGRGHTIEDGEKLNCVVCHGSGYEVSEFGEQVLSLVRRHLHNSNLD